MATRGYSLLELLLTTTISAVLLGLAVPAFQDFIAGQRATAAVNSIIGAVQHARANAIVHRHTVTFCPQRGSGCGGRDDWRHGGWIFADANQNARIDDGERIYGALPALPRGARLSWRSFRNRAHLKFRANGLTDWQNGHFQYCPPDGNPRHARQVILNAQGRARLAPDRDGDGIAEDARGRPLECR